jgi:hypothetical protein
MGGLVYDTGALIAAAHGDPAMWTLHRQAVGRDETPLVIAPVLARALSHKRDAAVQAQLARLLRGCALVDFRIGAAYDVGRLLALSGTTDEVAAAVVLAAVATRSAIVTSAPDDLEVLGTALGVTLNLAVIGLPVAV